MSKEQKILHNSSMATHHAYRAKRLSDLMPEEAKKAGKQAMAYKKRAKALARDYKPPDHGKRKK